MFGCCVQILVYFVSYLVKRGFCGGINSVLYAQVEFGVLLLLRRTFADSLISILLKERFCNRDFLEIV